MEEGHPRLILLAVGKQQMDILESKGEIVSNFVSMGQ
jgi:hypothetical protein